MSARSHTASRARTRAAESYRMAVGLGQAKVQFPGNLTGFGNFAGFY